ncbi:MAG: acetoacetyl-CoA reductase [Miltoncostaeaceae bacterium]|jgi:acetoacetyl-CoA reductase|nr:acetoacetyl-CoA reductase [Miltoncostaeaceae bacterium]
MGTTAKTRRGKSPAPETNGNDGAFSEVAPTPLGTGSLDGKVAIVTGASRGIGAAIARTLGAEGASVVVNYMSSRGPAEDVAADVERSGGKAAVIQADVSDETQCATLATDAVTAFGKVDILVNNAGVLEDQWFRKMDRLSFDRILATNLGSVFSMMKAVLPGMEARGFGRIVNMASFVGQTGNITQANYAAAKAGMVGLTKVVALEVAAKGITVNAVCPGFIGTEMVTGLSEKIQGMLLEKIPMGRFGDPEDIAKGVLYLVRDGDYITGSSLNINGGLVTAY